MFKIVTIGCIAGILGGVALGQVDSAQRARLNYLVKCQEKNGVRHFGSMLGSPRACNKVTCTRIEAVRTAVDELWDNARARGACVVWSPTRIQYAEQTESVPGVAAYADDGRGKQIGIVLNRE